MPFHYLGVRGNGYIVQNLDAVDAFIFLLSEDAYKPTQRPRGA